MSLPDIAKQSWKALKLAGVYNRSLIEGSVTISPDKSIGIGLSVSKNLVEINGGKIIVRSTVEKGSIFAVIFPVNEVEK